MSTAIVGRRNEASTLTKRGMSLLFLCLALTACGGEETKDLAPSVMRTDPAPQAKNVPVRAPIRVTFSYPVDPVTINKDTFFISGSSSVVGKIVYEEGTATATFTPSTPWAESTMYNAVLTTGVKDLDGIPLPSNFTWFFETAGADVTRPDIATTLPKEGAANVSRNTPIMITFSEPMQQETIHAETFFISGKTGRYEYDSATHTATLIVATLDSNTEYQVTVTTGVKDLAGNALATNKIWRFNTGVSTTPVAPPPPAPPPAPLIPRLLASIYPCDGMINVRVGIPSVWAKFREAMEPTSSIAGFNLQKEGEEAAVFGIKRYAKIEERLYFERFFPLSYDTWYVATLGEGIRSLSGETMPSHRWRFRTQADPNTSGIDPTPPGVQCTFPPGGSTHPVTTTVRAYFNKQINHNTVNRDTFIVQEIGGDGNDGDDEGGNSGLRGRYLVEFETTAIFDPRGDFKPGTTYQVTLTPGITDMAGNPLPSNFVWTFTVAP